MRWNVVHWFENYADQRRVKYSNSGIYALLVRTGSTKNICGAKEKDALDQTTVSKWLKKFHSGCKNLDNKASSAKPKSLNSEAALQGVRGKSKWSNHTVVLTWQQLGRIPVLFYQRDQVFIRTLAPSSRLCIVYAYVDIAFSRWDIATEVYEMVSRRKRFPKGSFSPCQTFWITLEFYWN